MENQVITQQVPVRTERMEEYQEKIKVPTTVQKPVTRKVARERIEFEPENHVRPVQTQVTTYKPEVVTEDVIIRTPIMERVVQKVQVPQRIARSVPYTEMRMVTRTYTHRVPIDFDGSIITSYPVVDSSTVVKASASGDGFTGKAAPASESNTSGSGTGTNIESKKPATSEEASLPAPKSSATKSELFLKPADGKTADKTASEKAASETILNKPPATGKIKLEEDQ